MCRTVVYDFPSFRKPCPSKSALAVNTFGSSAFGSENGHPWRRPDAKGTPFDVIKAALKEGKSFEEKCHSESPHISIYIL